jgi:hypothetical protein
LTSDDGQSCHRALIDPRTPPPHTTHTHNQHSSLTVATYTSASTSSFLSALGALHVAPNLTSLSLESTNMNGHSITIPALAPGAWPRLQSLSLPARRDIPWDTHASVARDEFTSLFLACGPGLQSLDLKGKSRPGGAARPDVLVEILGVLGDEVRGRQALQPFDHPVSSLARSLSLSLSLSLTQFSSLLVTGSDSLSLSNPTHPTRRQCPSRGAPPSARSLCHARGARPARRSRPWSPRPPKMASGVE